MELQTSATAEVRKKAPVYLFWDGEFLLNAPAKDAWPHVLNYSSWQNYPLIEHVSGPRNQEGEVVLLRKEEGGFSSPPYYARTIKLDPGQRVIWKVYLEKGTVEFDLSGIVEFRISETEDKRKALFSYHLLYEFLVPHRNEAELDAFRKQQQDSLESAFASMWPKLKKLVEQNH